MRAERITKTKASITAASAGTYHAEKDVLTLVETRRKETVRMRYRSESKVLAVTTPDGFMFILCNKLK